MTFIKFISVADHSHYMPFDMSQAKIHNKCDLWRYKDKKKYFSFYYVKNISSSREQEATAPQYKLNEKYLA